MLVNSRTNRSLYILYLTEWWCYFWHMAYGRKTQLKYSTKYGFVNYSYTYLLRMRFTWNQDIWRKRNKLFRNEILLCNFIRRKYGVYFFFHILLLLLVDLREKNLALQESFFLWKFVTLSSLQIEFCSWFIKKEMEEENGLKAFA